MKEAIVNTMGVFGPVGAVIASAMEIMTPYLNFICLLTGAIIGVWAVIGKIVKTRKQNKEKVQINKNQ